MPNLNKVMLMGNLTRDPQLSYLPSQTAVCEISIAINRRWMGQDGQQKEEVTFVECSMFGKRGEVLAKYLKKGQPIFVEGRLKLDQWEAQDGTKRSKLRVVLENFEFISARQGGGEGGGYEGGGDEGGYAPRPQQARSFTPRPAAGGRPVQQQRPAQPQQPQYDPGADAPAPPDDAPPAIPEDDIPF